MSILRGASVVLFGSDREFFSPEFTQDPKTSRCTGNRGLPVHLINSSYGAGVMAVCVDENRDEAAVSGVSTRAQCPPTWLRSQWPVSLTTARRSAR